LESDGLKLTRRKLTDFTIQTASKQVCSIEEAISFPLKIGNHQELIEALVMPSLGTSLLLGVIN